MAPKGRDGSPSRPLAWTAVIVAVFVRVAAADTIVFEGSGTATTTGELLEGVSVAWTTNQVQEIAGLEIRARTVDVSQTLNANNGYFGINSTLAGENLEAFDVGEQMLLTFDKDLRITRIDFNLFDSGETFEVAVGGTEIYAIAFDDLTNQSSDYIDFGEGILVEKDTTIAFYSTNGTIGLDSMNVTVIPEPAALGLVTLAGLGMLAVRRLVG